MLPRALHCAAHPGLDLRGAWRLFVDVVFKRLLVAAHHLLEHACGGHTGQIGTPGGSRQRQCESHQVMRGIADNRLVEVADVDIDAPFQIAGRSQIAGMTIAADPHRRPFRQAAPGLAVQPLIKLHRTAAYISVRGTGHFQIAKL